MKKNLKRILMTGVASIALIAPTILTSIQASPVHAESWNAFIRQNNHVTQTGEAETKRENKQGNKEQVQSTKQYKSINKHNKRIAPRRIRRNKRYSHKRIRRSNRRTNSNRRRKVSRKTRRSRRTYKHHKSHKMTRFQRIKRQIRRLKNEIKRLTRKL